MGSGCNQKKIIDSSMGNETTAGKRGVYEQSLASNPFRSKKSGQENGGVLKKVRIGEQSMSSDSNNLSQSKTREQEYDQNESSLSNIRRHRGSS